MTDEIREAAVVRGVIPAKNNKLTQQTCKTSCIPSEGPILEKGL